MNHAIIITIIISIIIIIIIIIIYYHHYLCRTSCFIMGKHVKPEDRRSSVKTCNKEVVSEHLVFKPFIKLQVGG